VSLTKRKPADFSAHPTISARERARYPTHHLERIEPGALSPTVVCDAALILPAQVPVRDTEDGHLFCVRCKILVAVEPARMAKAINAARAEGFVPEEKPVAGDLPGTLTPQVRAGLYWALKLRGMSSGDTGYDAALDIVKKAQGAMLALCLYEGGKLTSKGETLAVLIADPPVDERLHRTDDPSLAAPSKEKFRGRKAWIDSLVPRCASLTCYKPVSRDGACPCGHVERSPTRLAEIQRCWGIVDEKAPEKPKRKRAQKAEATP